MASSSHIKLPLMKVRTSIRTRNALLIYFLGFLFCVCFVFSFWYQPSSDHSRNPFIP